MDFLPGVFDVKAAIQMTLVMEGLVISEDTRNRLIAILNEGPCEVLVHTMELLYARPAELNESWWNVVAQCANLVTNSNFHSKAERALAILSIARFELDDAPEFLGDIPEPEEVYIHIPEPD